MNLIASVLHLDRQAIKALRITDPYSLHRVVYSLYDDVRSPDAKRGSEPSGILYADQGGDFLHRKIALLADRAPAACVHGRYGRVYSKPIPEGFLGHARYRFKVMINPTRRDSSTGKRVPVKGRVEIAQWFSERATKWGFQLSQDHLQVDAIDVLQFRDKAQRQITMARAHIQGILEVTDRQSFCNSFQRGIGRGRAFGCGLLQIVPLR